MQINCHKSDLAKSVQIVERSVGTKSSLPIMGNILIETIDEGVKLASNNLEIGMEVVIPATIASPGKILAPAKTLSSIVSKLPNDEVNLEIFDNSVIKISCSQSKFNIHGMDASEFLMLSKISEGEELIINANELKEAIKQVIFAVSLDESKHILNGVYFNFGYDEDDKTRCRMVATDGYRLALREFNLASPCNTQSNFVIPTKALNEIAGIIQGDDEEVVTIKHYNDQVSFAYKNNYLVTRVIQGQFPDFNQVIPKSSATTLVIDKKQFQEAAERCAIIASSSANIVKLENDNNKLLISAKTPDVGEVSELVETEVIGDSQTSVSFNVRLLIDVLKIVSADKIELNLTGSFSPGLVKLQGSDSYKYVIMPIRTSE